MKLLRMQPAFSVDLPVCADEAIKQMRAVIESSDFRQDVAYAGNCFDFRIAPKEQHFWSPHLSVQVSDTVTGSRLFGRYSPRPEIWTMFMAIYAIVLIVMFMSAIFGYVQWMLGRGPWTLVMLPIGVVIVFGIHVASLIGQRLSGGQMDALQSRCDQAINPLLRS